MLKPFMTEEIINLIRALLAASTILIAFNAINQHSSIGLA